MLALMAFCSRCKGATHESLSCLHTHARPTGVILVLAGRPACFEANSQTALHACACCTIRVSVTCERHAWGLRLCALHNCAVCAHVWVCSGTVCPRPRKSSCSKSSAAQYREVSTHHTACHCNLPAGHPKAPVSGPTRDRSLRRERQMEYGGKL